MQEIQPITQGEADGIVLFLSILGAILVALIFYWIGRWDSGRRHEENMGRHDHHDQNVETMKNEIATLKEVVVKFIEAEKIDEDDLGEVKLTRRGNFSGRQEIEGKERVAYMLETSSGALFLTANQAAVIRGAIGRTASKSAARAIAETNPETVASALKRAEEQSISANTAREQIDPKE